MKVARETRSSTGSMSTLRYYQVDTARSEENMVENVNLITLDTWSRSGTTVSPCCVRPAVETSSGPNPEDRIKVEQTTGEAILELRRRSGLTWELLGKLFDVSRRTIHHWANGKAPSAQHELDLRRTLDAVRHIDGGEQSVTRDRLLLTQNGLSIFDLLANRNYDKVLSLPEGIADTTGRSRTALRQDELERDRFPPFAPLLDALQDRPNIQVGKTRIADRVARRT